jgi:hypothetical protein
VMNSQTRLFIALSRLSRGAALTPET